MPKDVSVTSWISNKMNVEDQTPDTSMDNLAITTP